jgi:hypothetical protein
MIFPPSPKHLIYDEAAFCSRRANSSPLYENKEIMPCTRKIEIGILEQVQE